MKRRGVGRNSPVICFIGRAYKVIGRFLGTSEKSRIVVYEEIVI